jgi:hypothetical protein
MDIFVSSGAGDGSNTIKLSAHPNYAIPLL